MQTLHNDDIDWTNVRKVKMHFATTKHYRNIQVLIN